MPVPDTVVQPTEARAARIARAGRKLDEARTALMVTMRALDEAGEQSEAHRVTGVAVATIDDAYEAVLRGERRFAERARKDNALERSL